MKATITIDFDPAEYGVDPNDKDAVFKLLWAMINLEADLPKRQQIAIKITK